MTGRLLFNEELKHHTTFKIGGRARVWAEPESIESLKIILQALNKARLEPFLIGNGSNILADDNNIEKGIIKLSDPYFKRLTFDGRRVVCGSGLRLSQLIRACIKNKLSGLESLAGIPGTVGGAVMMNAGTGVSIGDYIDSLKVMDLKGKRVFTIKRERLKFSYRNSRLRGYIILEAHFILKKRSSAESRRLFNKALTKKIASQEYRLPNAGCVFKNPGGKELSSGRILDLCGLKGLRIGGAEFSKKHANFIVNKESARFSDVLSLIEIAQDIVKDNFGIMLEPEIKILK